MTPSPHQAAFEAFDRWLALAADEQAGWLDALATRDPALHRRVVDLIAADGAAEARRFLSLPPTTVVRADDATLAGTRLGPWLVEKLIGSGGMGHVWLARRTDGLYEGLAAIKLVRLAVADAGAAARFAREGQLLGRLSHPHIARLLDAGTAGGERYLVLEHVDGERIDHWCDRRRLAVDKRIALFLTVCEAVSHAHENLVVHRDLKPSNIFVSQDGQVKLLDFGVAKLIAEDAGDGVDPDELTRASGAAMTPAYAAPEQLGGGAITTATDVYALGLVLAGLLSGTRPQAGSASSSTRLADQQRPLLELPADAIAATTIAGQRGTTVAALKRALRGDLDVVVGKATRADAAERYRSVADFADDLRRVLDHRPIAARPESFAYRSAKFVRRHAFGVGATVAIAVAVAAGIAGTLVKQHEAEQEARRAVAVKRYLLDLFAQARTAAGGGTEKRELTVKSVLDAGADRIDQSFAGEPALRDELFGLLVGLYGETNDEARMTQLARQRLVAARRAFGPENTRVAPAETMMAAVLINFGGNDEARTLLDHAQAVLDRAGDRTSLERATLLRWQGALLQQTVPAPKIAWADHPMRHAAALMRERYPNEDDYLEVLVAVPGLACGAGARDEALAAVDELQRRTAARYGADSLFATQAELTRARTMMLAGQADASIPMLVKSIEAYRRQVGVYSSDVLISQLILAQAYATAGRHDEATRTLEAVSSDVRTHRPDDPRLAQRLVIYADRLKKIRSGDVPHCG